jgi:CO/xanthine dehydrogenase FAD-binding subunit
VQLANYQRPTTIDEALSLLAAERWQVVAGCTDYYCRPSARPHLDDVLDITAIVDARGVVDRGDHLRIGALTTWSAIAGAELPAQFDALREAARQVGGVQIQNTGTIAGNLCNASPAADGVPPLMMLDTRVELRSTTGTRSLRLDEFLLGNRRTALLPEELLVALLIPKRRGPHASRFLKLGARAYQVISIVMVAALIELDDANHIASAGICVGACSEVAQRLPALEASLIGRRIDGRALSSMVGDAHLRPLRPVTDVRASAEYRLDAARLLVGRALDDLQRRLR